MNRDAKPYHILVIEDNPGDLVIVEDLLSEQMSNFLVVQAISFEQASAILLERKRLFDVILLDLTLPDKGGPELAAEMLRVALSCPIIILTGYSDMSFSIGSIAMGISDYLLKDDLGALSLYKSIIYSIERKKAMLSLEESEKRYGDLFHLSPQPMWVCDADSLRFLDVNNSGLQEYGYAREEFLVLTLNDIVVKQNSVPVEGADLLLKDGARKSYQAVWLHKRKNNALIQVTVNSKLITYSGKAAILMLANDVTERMKYVAEIERQNEKLREIAWMQSHVVRAPLARMMGIVSLIKKLEFLPPEAPDLLNHFSDSFLELDTIVREIAKLSERVDVKN